MLARLTLLVVVSLPALAPAATPAAADVERASGWQRFNGQNQVPPAPLLMVADKRWDELSREEKERIRDARERYRKLPRDKQEKLRRQWEDLPDREKRKYRLEREEHRRERTRR